MNPFIPRANEDVWQRGFNFWVCGRNPVAFIRNLWSLVSRGKKKRRALGKRVAKSGFVRSTHDCCGLDLLLKEVKNVNMTSLEVPKKLFNRKFNKKKTQKSAEHLLNKNREIKIHVYAKRQTSDSSWEFLRIENKQIKTVQKYSYV